MGVSALPAELVVNATPGQELATVGLIIDGEMFLQFAANAAQLDFLIKSFGKARAVLSGQPADAANTVLSKHYKN